MRNIKMIVAYDGTDFCGWQRQPLVRTGQGVLTVAIEQIIQQKITLISSSRTDAGVHAYGQTVNFRCESQIELINLIKGVNSITDSDIEVQSACDVEPDFHSTFDAKGKFYRYLILRGPVNNPINRQYHLWCRANLDLEKMRQATEYMVGTVEYLGLQVKSDNLYEKTLRTVTAINFVEDGDYLFIDVYGKGFMYKQVRSMVGLLLEVGKEQIKVEDVKRKISFKSEKRRTVVAPSLGLTLMKVYYSAEEFDKITRR